jgi:hypothetical protein
MQKAQTYVAQVNTVNKLDKARLQSLKHERYSDDVVKEMIIDSDIKDRIAVKSRPSLLAGEVVSYSLFTETIDQIFKIESKKEARDLGRFLGRFFDELIGSFPEEFINNIIDINKISLINHNTTFAGYLILAKRFKDEDIKLNSLESIIKSIDFSKSNTSWEQIGVLDRGRLTKNAKENIMKFFKNINLEGGVRNE